MNTHYVFRVKDGRLIATPIAAVNVPFDYCSTRRLANVSPLDESEFNGFMNGFECAFAWVDELKRAQAASARLLMKVHHHSGTYSVSSDPAMHEKFSWITEKIDMTLRIRGKIVCMRRQPMSELELARCDIGDDSFTHSAHIFPIAGAPVAHDARGKIPYGFDNYAITRDYLTWDLYWK